MMGKRLIITPQVIEATSDSLKECIGLLHKNLVEILKEQGSINIYRPKIGQDLSILVTGQDYYCIHQDDPEHDHANTDLIDFYFVEVSPLTQRVCKMDFKENHMHLLDQKLAL